MKLKQWFLLLTPTILFELSAFYIFQPNTIENSGFCMMIGGIGYLIGFYLAMEYE